MGEVHLDEVYKVIDLILYKYQSAYKHLFPDLRASVFEVILTRRSRFNPDLDAYNFIYTMSRNEAGNLVLRWTKEFSIEDQMSTQEESYDIDVEGLDIPNACKKYIHYLTGEADYTIKRIARSDVLDLLVYLKMNDSQKDIEIPSYLKNVKNASAKFYKLLKDLLS